ncbi:MAG: hypothetical protein AAF465_00480 [Pseudomonadota bacterium]
MRALILGLLLLNILYFTWSKNIDTDPSRIQAALPADLPRLQLVESPVAQSEVEPGAASEQDAVSMPRVGADDVLSVDETVSDVAEITTLEAPVDDPVEPIESPLLVNADPVVFPQRCVGVGPFTSLRQASEAAALFNDAGVQTAQRVEEAQVWVGHWVHLPSYPTREAAIAVVETLREKGVKDIYIEPSGELKNTISLGLFSNLERAEVRAGNVRKLGDVKPQIRNRSRDGLVYWIDLSLESGKSLELNALPSDPNQEMKTEAIECPAPAVFS